jgi:hypothetical protein
MSYPPNQGHPAPHQYGPPPGPQFQYGPPQQAPQYQQPAAPYGHAPHQPPPHPHAPHQPNVYSGPILDPKAATRSTNKIAFVLGTIFTVGIIGFVVFYNTVVV